MRTHHHHHSHDDGSSPSSVSSVTSVLRLRSLRPSSDFGLYQCGVNSSALSPTSFSAAGNRRIEVSGT